MVKPLAVAAALLLGSTAFAQSVVTINFDNLANSTAPLENYAGLGVHFSSGGFGVVGGIGNGDPGNWLLEGSDGSKFLGFNGTGGYSITLTFDTPVAYVAVDVSRANGSASTDTFTLTTFDLRSVQLSTQTIALPTINVWQTVTASVAGITSVQLTNSGGSFRPYGVDRIQFSATAVPEPSTWVLLGLGSVFALGVVRRRRG